MANSMNNLTTLIKRLEAATSRLEDMVPSMGDQSLATNDLSAADQDAQTPGGTEQMGRSDASPSPAPLPPAIDDFDSMINGDVTKFVTMSEHIGGLVAEQSAALLRAFAAQRKFLIVTTKSKKPDIQSQIYMEILKELQSTMGAVNDIREANRPSPLFNHLTTVSEGIALLGWITIEPKPTDYITGALDSAQFYGNRVIKDYKERDRAHVEWAQAFYQIFRSLTAYVKQHYPSGVTWNKDGIDPADALHEVQSGQTPKPSTSAPGPPPPPPLPNFENAPSNSSNGSKGAMDAVFSQISSGENVTSHLRKVDPSTQTHKNPALRTSSAVPSGPIRSLSQTSTGDRKSPLPAKKPESMRSKKPTRKELDGNKWIIENFDDPKDFVEITASINQFILISRCNKTRIRINGKANQITLNDCSSTALVVDSLISNIDVIHCQNFEFQVLGVIPAVQLDQVDGSSIYLSKESLGTEIVTTLCTGVNIVIPGKSDDDDFVEKPVPVQMKHVIEGGELISSIVPLKE